MAADTAPQETLSKVAQGDAPVLERLVSMNLDSMQASGLDMRTYFLVRLAALVASDAAPVSYLINLGLAADAGVTLEEAQGALIAIAPVVGSARVAAAAGNILRAFGIAMVAEEMASQEDA
jgi:4-carboxymuconolactone decarboxylase